jgi:hypothetical protein
VWDLGDERRRKHHMLSLFIENLCTAKVIHYFGIKPSS